MPPYKEKVAEGLDPKLPRLEANQFALERIEERDNILNDPTGNELLRLAVSEKLLATARKQAAARSR